ncbi:Pac2p NDAI_0B01030 [Naumovozyma dairenensis CBS 421]|uniref:CAP-Gly domain-containing protein n=1 Tax=Naumovozyma dairenensis (strain ATCC 10597 / BCRC 20456 / CBS 421 / NBRC 0211 / NRRL Y-12639) TaxID=1071378 RepID=G0W5S6_NAUDC|nr:hypothetical protein NDAI_0B01030 [Naumovozyma dairenensis CBS 421]CCD23137.1 hypothetical protein NDAI_0B01030 [Naumovozyma dairenensis CBS 421]
MAYEVGDRLQIDNELGTILFKGKIKEWPSEEAYGIEWDNPNRGKHSGTVHGESYFKTLIPDSATFIKEPKLLVNARKNVTFYGALQGKYGDSSYISGLVMGTKEVEALGFEQLNYRNKDFSSLRHVSLSRSCICKTREKLSDIILIKNSCNNVETLDLSYNTFSSFKDVVLILECLSKLKTLNLNGNRFISWEGLDGFKITTLEHLSMSSCYLSPDNVQLLLQLFPNLKQLDISYNLLESLPDKSFTIPKCLKGLNLSCNQLYNMPKCLGQWKLEELNLSHNLFSEVSSINSETLRDLDISDNKFVDWTICDELNKNLAQLNSLRINGNPLFTSSSKPETELLYETLARFDHLHIVNGSSFSLQERKEAELYFVSKILSDEIRFEKNLGRWEYFNAKYDIEMKLEHEKKSWLDNLLLEIEIHYHGNHFPILVMTNYTIRHLKTIIIKRLALHVNDVKLSFRISNDIVFEIDKNFSTIEDTGIQEKTKVFVTHNGQEIENRQTFSKRK